MMAHSRRSGNVTTAAISGESTSTFRSRPNTIETEPDSEILDLTVAMDVDEAANDERAPHHHQDDGRVLQNENVEKGAILSCLRDHVEQTQMEMTHCLKLVEGMTRRHEDEIVATKRDNTAIDQRVE